MAKAEPIEVPVIVNWTVEGPAAYLVIHDQCGIFSAVLDRDRAHQAAQAIGAVVVELPISVDYRNQPTRGNAG